MSKSSSDFLTKIKTLRLLSLSALLTSLITLSTNGQTESIESKIELKSWVDRSQIPFNRELAFTVEASWEGEQDRFSITPVAPPECEKFELLGTSSLNESTTEEGKSRSVKIFKFTLRPVETGRARIGSVQLSYVDNLTQDSSSLSTHPISVEVTPPVKESGPKYKTVLLVVVLLVLAYVIWSAMRRRRGIDMADSRQTQKLRPEEESLEDKTLGELAVISGKVQAGELRGFPSEVYKLLAGYLEAKYPMVASGKTTEDIIRSLSNLNLASETAIFVKSILSTCDLMKFAKDKLEKDECGEIITKLRQFLEQNR